MKYNCEFGSKKINYLGSFASAELTENTATVTFPNITRKYTFVQISDLHIDHFTEGDSDEDFALTDEGIKCWEPGSTPLTANADGRVYHSVHDVIRLLVERINDIAPDAVFLCGDVSDAPTASSYEKTYELISGLRVPYVATPGNHEVYRENYSERALRAYRALYPEQPTVSSLQIGEVKIINLNSSLVQQTDENRLILEKELTDSSIIVTHVPFFTEGLLRVTSESFASYFLAGMPNHKPDTVRFAEMIRERKPLVCAGHAHCTFDHPGEEPLQLVSAPAFDGFYRVITLVPEE